MCGFATFFEIGVNFDPELLRAVSNDLHHRGPDGGGIVNEPGVAMVFRRLAIIDPTEKSNQPMSDQSGRYSMVFNGEIYNFRLLRKQLTSLGVSFITNGDAEVVLKSYMRWGYNCFIKFEGMFSIVIWDREEKKIVVARDPFGIKPLYRTKRGSFFGFASELRALRRFVKTEVDLSGLSELLLFRYAAAPQSGLTNIEQVPPGHICIINMCANSINEWCYCDPLDFLKNPKPGTADQLAKRTQNALTESVKAHLQSDAGYSLQLSGGIDSSLIAALSVESGKKNSPRSFGLHLPQSRSDEAEYRNMVHRGYHLDHTEVTVTTSDFMEAWPLATWHMESPVPHYGCVMLMLLCFEVSKTDKVVLTGEGADELFGGYKRYGQWKQLRRHELVANLVPYKIWPLLSRYRYLTRFKGNDAAIFSSVYHDFENLFQLFPGLSYEVGIRGEMRKRFKDFRSRMMAVDQKSYLASLLMRQDKMSMAASVEARVPFVHLPLWREVNSIPIARRLPTNDTKPLLKHLAEKYLPYELIHRRKIGLNVPVSEWIASSSTGQEYCEFLISPDSRIGEFGDKKAIRKVVGSFRAGQRKGLPPIEHLINMELWLRSLELEKTDFISATT